MYSVLFISSLHRPHPCDVALPHHSVTLLRTIQNNWSVNMILVTVGVLALQGGFYEHSSLLRKASREMGPRGQSLRFVEVRTPPELSTCDALVIPGGESTTMALVAAQSGLLEPLRHFVK